jgi:hypothetical protein
MARMRRQARDAAAHEKRCAVSPIASPAAEYRRSTMTPLPRVSTATTVLHRVP